MKFNNTFQQMLTAAIKTRNTVFLVGEPGIGKSSAVEAFAKDVLCTKCFTLACNQLADKADLTGARLVPYTDSSGQQSYKQVFYPHQVICDANDYAIAHPNEKPVLFMDEINRSTSDVTSACLSLVTLRAIGSLKLAENLIIIAAGNDKGNVSTLDEASISRFIKINVTPDTATFLGLDPELNPFIRQTLEKNPDLIFCKSLDTTVKGSTDDDGNEVDESLSIDDIITDGEGMMQITTPRTISALSAYLNQLDNKHILEMLMTPAVVEGVEANEFMEIVVGFVGYTNFAVTLVDLIQLGINTMSSTASASLMPTKPACYDELKNKAVTDMVQLNEFIDNLNEKQKSSSLLYALYENSDNAMLIKQLGAKTLKFERDDMSMFSQLFTADKFPKSITGGDSNVDVFLEYTPLGRSVATLF